MLFGRRWLQECLDDISDILESHDMRSLSNKLNAYDETSIHAQWELAVVWAASRLADVRYEPETGGDRRADLLVTRKLNMEIEVLMEIVGVSSKGFDEKNPVDRFTDELFRQFGDESIAHRRYELNVGSYYTGQGEAWEVRAAVPHPRDYPVFFGPDFKAFMRKVHRREPCAYEVDEERIKVRLSHDPDGAPGMSGGWGQFDYAASLERNPIFKALRKKRRQLRDSGFTGLKGIVLCNSGSWVFQQGQEFHTNPVNADNIVLHFLKESPRVDFVVLLTPHSPRHRSRYSIYGLFGDPPGPEVLLFTQPGKPSLEISSLRKLIHDIGRILPKPSSDAHNVLLWQRRTRGKRFYVHGDGDSSHPRYKKSYTTARISTRLLLDYMLGMVDYKTFQHEAGIGWHGLNDAKKFHETLRTAQVIRQEGDDDWFELRFEGPDAAEGLIRPLEVPKVEGG